MRSSLKEAISLLKKWKATDTEMIIFFSDGPPDTPNTFFFSIAGVVQEISDGWVEVMGEGCQFRLKLDRPNTEFEYVEATDRRLEMEDDEREVASQLFEGTLSVLWDDEKFCVFTIAREDTELDSE